VGVRLAKAYQASLPASLRSLQAPYHGKSGRQARLGLLGLLACEPGVADAARQKPMGPAMGHLGGPLGRYSHRPRGLRVTSRQPSERQVHLGLLGFWPASLCSLLAFEPR
jgi:hypothetical protein